MDDIATLEELRDWLRNEVDPSCPLLEYANAIDRLLTERAKMLAEKEKPLFEMSLAELQTMRGQIDSFIRIKVCGDPRVCVSFPTQPPKATADE